MLIFSQSLIKKKNKNENMFSIFVVLKDLEFKQNCEK